MAKSPAAPASASRNSGRSNTVGGGDQKPRKTANTRFVWAGRIVFLATLLSVAAIFGFLTHYILTEAEQKLARKQFSSIATRSAQAAAAIVERKRLGTQSMATMASHIHPDASAWPFVTIVGYEAFATDLIETSSGREMGFCPLVTPDKAQAFEDFAYTYYNTTRLPEPFTEGTADSSFGKGIWGQNPALNSSDNRYHDVSGETYYNSSYSLMAPILHHNEGAFPALMLNLRFQETRGRAIDALLDHAALRHAAATSSASILPAKGLAEITDMIILTSQGAPVGPGALLMQPIYPANDPTVLTGLVASSIVWDEVLFNIFPKSVNGIHCVLRSDTAQASPSQIYTYKVQKGEVVAYEESDTHSSDYNTYEISVVLTEGQFSATSPTYTLALYPTEEFFAVYATNNPLVATLGAVFIIVFTSLLFVLYDYLVRREFTAKKELLDAKRKFMAYVSHEVRTPLNSLCLGLELIRDEMKLAVGLGGGKKKKTTAGIRTKPLELLTVKSVDSGKVVDWIELSSEIFRNAQSAVDVLTDLLNYDKIEMGKLSLELSVVPIWELTYRTVSEFKLQAARKNIEFIVDFGSLYDAEKNSDEESFKSHGVEMLPQAVLDQKVVGDSIRISQSLRNLVSNALKFTPEQGSMTVKVEWHDRQQIAEHKRIFKLHGGNEISLLQNGQVTIAVSDTGAGMSQDQLDRLFKDGVQFNVNKLQAGQGSGLGLFITKGIVEQHGGFLTVESGGLNKGTTFNMTLPLFNDPSPFSPSKTASVSASEVYRDTLSTQKSQASLPMRILVVDDSVMNLKLLTRILRTKGHQCCTAVNGDDAVAAVREAGSEQPYDSILLDYEMPEMDGPTAATAIRALGCDSFIVGITGNMLPEDVAHFIECGANHVLAKPFNLKILEGIWEEYGVASCGEESSRVIDKVPVVLSDDNASEHA